VASGGDASGFLAATGRRQRFSPAAFAAFLAAQNRCPLPVLHCVAVAGDAATPSDACSINDKAAMGATL
jgi:hypothetical protein